MYKEKLFEMGYYEKKIVANLLYICNKEGDKDQGEVATLIHPETNEWRIVVHYPEFESALDFAEEVSSYQQDGYILFDEQEVSEEFYFDLKRAEESDNLEKFEENIEKNYDGEVIKYILSFKNPDELYNIICKDIEFIANY